MPLLPEVPYQVIAFRTRYETYSVLHDEVLREFLPGVRDFTWSHPSFAPLLQVCVFDERERNIGGDSFRWNDFEGGALGKFLEQDLRRRPTLLHISLTLWGVTEGARVESEPLGPFVRKYNRRAESPIPSRPKPVPPPTRFNRKEIV